MKKTYTTPLAETVRVHFEQNIMSDKFNTSGQGDFDSYGVSDYDGEDWS